MTFAFVQPTPIQPTPNLTSSLLELKRYYQLQQQQVEARLELIKEQVYHINALLSSSMSPPGRLSLVVEPEIEESIEESVEESVEESNDLDSSSTVRDLYRKTDFPVKPKYQRMGIRAAVRLFLEKQQGASHIKDIHEEIYGGNANDVTRHRLSACLSQGVDKGLWHKLGDGFYSLSPTDNRPRTATNTVIRPPQRQRVAYKSKRSRKRDPLPLRDEYRMYTVQNACLAAMQDLPPGIQTLRDITRQLFEVNASSWYTEAELRVTASNAIGQLIRIGKVKRVPKTVGLYQKIESKAPCL